MSRVPFRGSFPEEDSHFSAISRISSGYATAEMFSGWKPRGFLARHQSMTPPIETKAEPTQCPEHESSSSSSPLIMLHHELLIPAAQLSGGYSRRFATPGMMDTESLPVDSPRQPTLWDHHINPGMVLDTLRSACATHTDPVPVSPYWWTTIFRLSVRVSDVQDRIIAVLFRPLVTWDRDLRCCTGPVLQGCDQGQDDSYMTADINMIPAKVASFRPMVLELLCTEPIGSTIERSAGAWMLVLETHEYQ